MASLEGAISGLGKLTGYESQMIDLKKNDPKSYQLLMQALNDDTLTFEEVIQVLDGDVSSLVKVNEFTEEL